MTRSQLLALASLLAATLLSAPSHGQQQPPAAGARPPAAAPAPAQAGQQPQGSQQSVPPGGPGQVAGPPWPVMMVTSVEVLRSTRGGDLDIVRARGLVTSDAWSEPRLLPLTQGEPQDGVLELVLRANAPGGAMELGPFMVVEAILPVEPDHPYEGVRVRASSNAVTLKALPGYAEVPAPKKDCAKCLGKYFVAKGAKPPAGVPADNIVREADLPWPLKVIRPDDGIASYAFDPNRLTLVLSEDGRIVDAAWD